MVRCPRCHRRIRPSGDCSVHGRPTTVGVVQHHEDPPNIVAPGEWTLGPLLAVGGTAFVYELRGGRGPAVFKLARHGDRDAALRFSVEADVLRTVGAPMTPALYDQGVCGERPYLVMEHVSGETLAAWMARNGERGGLGEILAILARVAAALGAVHHADYVHRDLKPENIAIGVRGTRLLDFGLAHRRGGTVQHLHAGAIVGTPHYLAPEQQRPDVPCDDRADVYSFGIIAYEMLAARPPFVGERRAIEYQHQVVRPAAIRDTRSIPVELDDLVLSCLAKDPMARPSINEFRTRLAAVTEDIGTLRGVGSVSSSQIERPVGTTAEVALVWIVGGDLVTIVRSVAKVNGIIAKQRGDGVLAVFNAQQIEAPLAVALGIARELARGHCRIAIHLGTALLRRTAHGKLMVYGKELEPEPWIPSAPFDGVVLTAAAARREGTPVIALDVPGFFRVLDPLQPDTTELQHGATLVGRSALLDQIDAWLDQPALVAISGEDGVGKSRVLSAVAERMRARGREVIEFSAIRRFIGDHGDDERLVEALGARELSSGLAAAGTRRAVVIVDNVDLLSRATRDALLAAGVARVLASEEPIVEVSIEMRDRVSVELPPLEMREAMMLVRSQLRPARLLPDALIERLAMRGMGIPRMLLALASDLKRRGAIRRDPGSDELYVAIDELDTLLVPPTPDWFVQNLIDELPPDVAETLLGCSALGPSFSEAEVAALFVAAHIEYLVRRQLLDKRDGVLRFANPRIQDVLYATSSDRLQIHERAFEFWLAVSGGDPIARLARVAFHAAGAGARVQAAAAYAALARAARARDDHEHADLVLQQQAAVLLELAVPEVRAAIERLGAMAASAPHPTALGRPRR